MATAAKAISEVRTAVRPLNQGLVAQVTLSASQIQ
jgi:hypothetical protein